MNLKVVDVPQRVSELLGGRVVCWSPSDRLVGDYDGRQRTLEVFHAALGEQMDLLRRLRPVREEIERLIEGPLVVIFHSPKESERLYAEECGTARAYRNLAENLARWTGPRDPGEGSYDPDKLDGFRDVAA